MLTKEDLATLGRHFAVKDHEFLNGLIYLREDDVTERLDEVDPNWSFEIVSVLRGDSQVTVHARLTVKDITRDGVGMHSIATSKSGNEVGEAEKSAATDALKRAARLFGVGRYLLALKGITNHAQLEQVLTGKPPAQRAPQAPPPSGAKPAGKPKNAWVTVPTGWKVFEKKIQDLEAQGISRHAMLEALGVYWVTSWETTMTEYAGTLTVAIDALQGLLDASK